MIMRLSFEDDKALIDAIRGSYEEREAAMRHIFKNLAWRDLVYNYLKQRDGAQDADDVFQQAIVAFDRNIRMGRYEGNSRLKTYFLSIAKRIWWKMLRARKPQLEFKPEYEESTTESIEIQLIQREQKLYIAKVLSLLGDRCKKVLQLYQLDYSMEEIAKALVLSNANMAKKQAYRCRNKMKQFLENNPNWKTLIN